MTIAEIIALLASLADAGTKLFVNFSQVSDLFQQMAAEGRTTLTPAEEQAIVTIRDQARADLQTAIDKA